MESTDLGKVEIKSVQTAMENVCPRPHPLEPLNKNCSVDSWWFDSAKTLTNHRCESQVVRSGDLAKRSIDSQSERRRQGKYMICFVVFHFLQKDSGMVLPLNSSFWELQRVSRRTTCAKAQIVTDSFAELDVCKLVLHVLLELDC